MVIYHNFSVITVIFCHFIVSWVKIGQNWVIYVEIFFFLLKCGLS